MKELFEFLIQNAESFLSWKLLLSAIFISFSFLGLCFTNALHDILQDMFNTIVTSCIFFSLLVVCKIASQLTELIEWKHAEEKRRNLQEEKEQENLFALLSLSKKEIAILKYIFKRPTCSAWLPKKLTEAILLYHKGYIKIISKKRPAGTIFDNMDIKNFYKSNSDILYTINADTKKFIEAHQEEIMSVWQKIKIDKKLNQYQD